MENPRLLIQKDSHLASCQVGHDFQILQFLDIYFLEWFSCSTSHYPGLYFRLDCQEEKCPTGRKVFRKETWNKAYTIFIHLFAVLYLMPQFLHGMCGCPERLLLACSAVPLVFCLVCMVRFYPVLLLLLFATGYEYVHSWATTKEHLCEVNPFQPFIPSTGFWFPNWS